MKLTSRGEYGLLAMVYLARHYGDGLCSAQVISTEKQIPLKFLEQILQTLRLAKYIQSVKGQHGGYQLVQAPDQINLADLLRLLDGPLAPTGCVSLNFYASTPIEKEEKLVSIFSDIRDYTIRKLEDTTLADIV